MSKPKSEGGQPKPLRTVDDITTALEELYEKQRSGQMDPKTADAMNTTLKGVMYLRVKMKMEMFKLVIQSQIKKLEIPQGVLDALPINVTPKVE